ncbi:MAG: hypothetical protein ABI324_05235, partial [Ktedonobacteraceae bacterium]
DSHWTRKRSFPVFHLESRSRQCHRERADLAPMDQRDCDGWSVNLSLVVLPPGSNSPPEGVTEDIIATSRDLLRLAMQNLADAGGVFVASAGNDSDPATSG